MIRNAIVIGGGIGGLAVATALAKSGVAVTLCERATEMTEVGAGLQISPNGLAVLRALGLEEALLRSGAVEAQAVVLADYRRSGEVARLDLTRLRHQRYLFVHRADLVALLERSARQANVSVTLGAQATQISPGDPPQVRFADGSQARAELIVCADGLHSVGRRALLPEAKPFFTGQVAWRALVPASDAAPEADGTRATRSDAHHGVVGRPHDRPVVVQECVRDSGKPRLGPGGGRGQGTRSHRPGDP